MQREEFEEQKNSIKHRVTKEDVYSSIKEYLGKYADVLRDISIKEYETFTKLLPKVERKAYFVKGSESMLKKFKAYFIAKCVIERYDYASFMLKSYIEGLSTNNDNELFLAGISKELLFLYLHHEASGTGGTENWIATSTLDRMVNRKREGLITVLLSERTFPTIEKSKEITCIDLGGAKKGLDVKAALDSMKSKITNEGDDNESTKSTSIYD